MADFFAGESFAVVDLETTGTRKEEGDRIIQFGCAIVKDGEVVKTYSFMMNPPPENSPVRDQFDRDRPEDGGRPG